jgi:hypothetical protein
MEHTSNNVVLENKNAFHSVSDNNSDNNLGLKENSNIMIDATLKYLRKVLLEEEIHEENIVYEEGSDLCTMEKHFYNIHGEEYPLPFYMLSPSDQRESNLTGSYYPWHCQIGSKDMTVSGINQGDRKETHILPSADNMASNSQVNNTLFLIIFTQRTQRTQNSHPTLSLNFISRNKFLIQKSSDLSLDFYLLQRRGREIMVQNEIFIFFLDYILYLILNLSS